MEIIDYLRIMRKRIVLLLLIPLVAAGAAAAYVQTRPDTYRATATVSTVTLVGTGDFTGTQATSQFVAAFVATATGPIVINDVATQTGVGPFNLNSNLDVDQSGASSDMNVTFTSTKKAVVQEVLAAEVKSTLTAMYQPRAELAKKQLDAASAAVNEATEALAAYTKKIKIADPAQQYQALLSRVNNLVQQQANLRATGYPTAAAALDAPIKSTQDKLVTFTSILQHYDQLSASQKAAIDDLSNAQSAYRQASIQLTAAQSPEIVYTRPTSLVDRTGTLLTLVISAFGAGFLLALILAVAMELLRGAKRHEPDTSAPAASPGGESAEDAGPPEQQFEEPSLGDGTGTVLTRSQRSSAQ